MKDAVLKMWRDLLKPLEIILKYIYIYIYIYILELICLLQKKNEKVIHILRI